VEVEIERPGGSRGDPADTHRGPSSD
jgi:hypothetical protein